jgi:hypothetical protein
VNSVGKFIGCRNLGLSFFSKKRGFVSAVSLYYWLSCLPHVVVVHVFKYYNTLLEKFNCTSLKYLHGLLLNHRGYFLFTFLHPLIATTWHRYLMDTRGFSSWVKVVKVWRWLLTPFHANVKKITDAVILFPHIPSHHAHAQLYQYVYITYDLNVTNSISFPLYNLSCQIIFTFWDYIVSFSENDN